MSNPNGVRFGAIRWDAWYPTSIPGYSTQACHWFDLPQFQFRSPFFSTQVSDYSMSINGNSQATMDAEIAYAKAGKIAYWAFGWYDPASPNTGSFHQAWTLYQSSTHKADVNWCVISNPSSYLYGQIDDGSLVTLMQQSNYEKVLTNRPLLYLILSSIPSPGDTLTAKITALRAGCIAAGLGSPYVVVLVLGLLPSQVATACTNVGADAITMYAWGPPTSLGAYSTLDTAVRAQWALQAATGLSVIPTAVFGWDRRPIFARPATFYALKPYMGQNNSYLTATPAECATNAQALITWMGANPAACPANSALIYAWNEFAEGGWCCPTWTAGGPDHSRLDALASVL